MSGYYNSQQVGLNGTMEQNVRGGRSGESQVVAQVVHNQHYDESVEVSDGEEVASTNPTPREGPESPNGDYRYPSQQPQGTGGVARGVVGSMTYEEEEEEEESGEEQSESEEEEAGPHRTLALSGAYDPAEFEHLAVSSELKELFQHIERYTPETVVLETRLRPFVPEYIPSIGDIDAFLKVTRPDGKCDNLGLVMLDEPTVKQSDPTVLDLQLRTLTKQPTVKPVTVHSIAEPEKQSKALDNWIDSISELHRQKPATNVHYTKNMPDIEILMQEWAPRFEEALKEVGLPTADLDCDLPQYTDIICSLLDIPVYKNRIHSLHVLFSLYMEFKNSQHFKSLAEAEPLPEKPRSDSVIPEV